MDGKAITFNRVNWSVEAENKLIPALKGDAMYIKSQVFNSEAGLWSVNNGESYFVIRIVREYMIIVAYAGINLLKAAPYIVREAERLGLQIRFHTTNPALIRLLKRYAPMTMEYVLRINPNDFKPC